MPLGWGEAIELLREFGLPLAGLALFASALLFKRKRKRDGVEVEGAPLLVPGWQLDALQDELAAVRQARSEREFSIRTEATERAAYVEARRIEERQARLASDALLAEALKLMRDQGQTLDELRIDVARLTGIRPGRRRNA